jgi:hypothetical protein
MAARPRDSPRGGYRSCGIHWSRRASVPAINPDLGQIMSRCCKSLTIAGLTFVRLTARSARAHLRGTTLRRLTTAETAEAREIIVASAQPVDRWCHASARGLRSRSTPRSHRARAPRPIPRSPLVSSRARPLPVPGNAIMHFVGGSCEGDRHDFGMIRRKETQVALCQLRSCPNRQAPGR